MAPHSSPLAWKIPWREEPGRLQSVGPRRVGLDFSFTFTFHFHALEKEMATHSSVLPWRIPETAEPGWAAIYWVARSRTRLKRLSSSSSSSSRGVIFYYSQGINFDIVNPLWYSDILCLLISSLILFPFCLLFSIYFVSLFYDVLICFL